MSFTRQLVGVLAVSAVLLFAPLHGAQAAGGKFASIVIAADSGRVLYDRNAEARRYPASLTKIMEPLVLQCQDPAGRI